MHPKTIEVGKMNSSKKYLIRQNVVFYMVKQRFHEPTEMQIHEHARYLTYLATGNKHEINYRCFLLQQRRHICAYNTNRLFRCTDFRKNWSFCSHHHCFQFSSLVPYQSAAPRFFHRAPRHTSNRSHAVAWPRSRFDSGHRCSFTNTNDQECQDQSTSGELRAHSSKSYPAFVSARTAQPHFCLLALCAVGTLRARPISVATSGTPTSFPMFMTISSRSSEDSYGMSMISTFALREYCSAHSHGHLLAVRDQSTVPSILHLRHSGPPLVFIPDFFILLVCWSQKSFNIP